MSAVTRGPARHSSTQRIGDGQRRPGWGRRRGHPREALLTTSCLRVPGLRREAAIQPLPNPAPPPPPVLQPNSSNDNIQSITSGDWDVTKILSYDEKRSQM